jgi:hypothetical protein
MRETSTTLIPCVLFRSGPDLSLNRLVWARASWGETFARFLPQRPLFQRARSTPVQFQISKYGWGSGTE